MSSTEFEARFLNIDKQKIQQILKDLQATLVHSETLFERSIYDTPKLKNAGGWLRLRKELDKVTLTAKINTQKMQIDRYQESEIIVNDFHDTRELLHLLGLKERTYQQSKREKWNLDGISIDIDTWPKFPSFIEIEGPDPESVFTTAQKLGFNEKDAVYESIDELIKKDLGIDIKYEKTWIF